MWKCSSVVFRVSEKRSSNWLSGSHNVRVTHIPSLRAFRTNTATHIEFDFFSSSSHSLHRSKCQNCTPTFSNLNSNETFRFPIIFLFVSAPHSECYRVSEREELSELRRRRIGWANVSLGWILNRGIYGYFCSPYTIPNVNYHLSCLEYMELQYIFLLLVHSFASIIY